MRSPESPDNRIAYGAGAATLVLAIAVITGAWGFEYLGGLAPCPLCLEQRFAYYAAIPLLFVALALVAEMPRVAAAIFAVVAMMFLANTGLGIYHAGAEWKFWPGPDTCGTVQAVPKSAADLLDAAEKAVVVRCDEAAWRFAGLSLAGWNVVMSLLLVAGALRAAFFSARAR